MTKDIFDNLSHYAVLSLPTHPASNPATSADIKAAYHRALLLHHPDKSRSSRTTTQVRSTLVVSIDRILLAYKVLSSPAAKAEYDGQLRLHLPYTSLSLPDHDEFKQPSFSGIEPIDLDDLDYDEEMNVWYRSCRCGQNRGFVVTEQQLEEGAGDGMVVVGCGGCSLWVMVMFQAVLEDIEDSTITSDG